MTSSSAAASSSKKTRRAKAKLDETVLRFPSIPEELVEKIISFLPIKDSFAYSYISRRFIDSWKFSRNLTFNINFFHRYEFSVFKRIMDEHSGPVIEKMNFVFNPAGKEDQILDWIRKANAKGLKDLELIFFTTRHAPFVLPSDLFDGSSLHSLTLQMCETRFLIDKFDGFRCLKKIALVNIFILHGFTSEIFKNCLFLESFEITGCNSERIYFFIHGSHLKYFKVLKMECFNQVLNIKINAPHLQVFHYVGEACSIIFRSQMNKIVEVLVHFDPIRAISFLPGIETIMISLRFMRRLSISGNILERICAGLKEYGRMFHDYLQNLREIQLFLSGSKNQRYSTFINPFDVAFFLTKSPYLEKLIIDFGMYHMEAGVYWQNQAKAELEALSANFKFLKSVNLLNFKFRDLEIKLAAFILTKAKSLENCVIVKAKNHRGEKESHERYFFKGLSMRIPSTTTLMVYEHNTYEESAWSIPHN